MQNKSRNKMEISVMFSVLFGTRRSHQTNSSENKELKQSDRVGNEVVFIFKFNCKIGKCSVIVHDLPPKFTELSRFYKEKLPCMQACSM